MIENNRIAIVMPAYNAAKTLKMTMDGLPEGIVDDIILVDDCSTDDTVAVAESLGIFCVRHDRNKGYGGNQKTCYQLALQRGADIIIMLHPDYQYDPRLVPAMAWMLMAGPYDIILASRILGGRAVKDGMPKYKYFFNRVLTLIQNIFLGSKLSEYHTGFRGYRRHVMEGFDYSRNSDDFIFDNQFLCQAIFKGFCVGEISCPAKYFPEASSINFRRSVVYGLGVLITSVQFYLARKGRPGRLFR